MTLVACNLPSESAVDRRFSQRPFFADAYRTQLRNPDASVIDAFQAVFGHRPTWMKRLFIARNRLVALFGIDTPADAEIMSPAVKAHYRVGDTIGSWPIFALTGRELVAGRDNSHLDFRLSILKVPTPIGTDVVVSTMCDVHNLFGKIYLRAITPFHKRGVQWLIARAIAAGRL